MDRQPRRLGPPAEVFSLRTTVASPCRDQDVDAGARVRARTRPHKGDRGFRPQSPEIIWETILDACADRIDDALRELGD